MLTLPQDLLPQVPQSLLLHLFIKEWKKIVSLSHLNPGLHRRPELISEKFVSIHDIVYYGSIIFILMHFYFCSKQGKKELVHNAYIIFTIRAQERKQKLTWTFLQYLMTLGKVTNIRKFLCSVLIIAVSPTHSKKSEEKMKSFPSSDKELLKPSLLRNRQINHRQVQPYYLHYILS